MTNRRQFAGCSLRRVFVTRKAGEIWRELNAQRAEQGKASLRADQAQAGLTKQCVTARNADFP
jgi:hypothetical protein